MKKVILFSIVVIFVSFLFSGCQNQTVTTEKEVVTVTKLDNPGTDGFVLKVKRGDTVWDFSQKIYGSGFKWRDIVSQNPFLNEPGRVEKRDGKWIVWIYPGEEIHINGSVIKAGENGQITETIKTTQTTTTPVPIVPWWGWLLILAGILFFIWLFWFYRTGGAMAWASSSAAVHVNILSNIDRDTRAVLLGREQDRRDRFAKMISRDARKGRIKNFTHYENPNEFFTNVNYRKPGEKTPKPKEDKKDAKSEEPQQ